VVGYGNCMVLLVSLGWIDLMNVVWEDLCKLFVGEFCY